MQADLVLEGGGVKGIALVGVTEVLAERGYRFERVAGTSAGSIVGAVVAAGMPPGEMVEEMRQLDYRRFADPGRLDRLGLVGKAVSVLAEQGVYEGQALKTWLGELLDRYGVTTFADLRREDAGSSLPPELESRLVVIASDISDGRLRRLPWDYHLYGLDPLEVPVVDAVRASSSIPFVYEPVRLRREGGDEESWLVDGGLLSNFPVAVFDRTDGALPRWPTFGVKLSARPEARLGRRRRITGVVGYTKAILGTLTAFYDQIHVDNPSVQARTIFVDTFEVRATDFDLDDEGREALYRSGRQAALEFLDGTAERPGWDFDRWLRTYRGGAS